MGGIAAPILYAHPFSSYCWKVLIALWENDLGFDYRSIAEPAYHAEWQSVSPAKRMPLLVDGAAIVPESTIIIEHLQLYHRGAAPMLPDEPKAALNVRMLDRLVDNYLMAPVQALVFDRNRAESDRSAVVVRQAHGTLATSYRWWNDHMNGREWAAEGFGLADCAAGPALFYADWVHPIPDDLSSLRGYRDRLLARPSMKRAVDEARPFRSLFPFGDPGRD